MEGKEQVIMIMIVLIKNLGRGFELGTTENKSSQRSKGDIKARCLLRVQCSNHSVTLPPRNINCIFFIKVKYTGTKDYNTSFLDIGEQDAKEGTNYLVENLVPGTLYNFKVSGESVCVEGQPTAVEATTNMSGKQKHLQLTKI